MLASFWGSSLIVIYSNIVTETTKQGDERHQHTHHYGWHSKRVRITYNVRLDWVRMGGRRVCVKEVDRSGRKGG